MSDCAHSFRFCNSHYVSKGHTNRAMLIDLMQIRSWLVSGRSQGRLALIAACWAVALWFQHSRATV